MSLQAQSSGVLTSYANDIELNITELLRKVCMCLYLLQLAWIVKYSESYRGFVVYFVSYSGEVSCDGELCIFLTCLGGCVLCILSALIPSAFFQRGPVNTYYYVRLWLLKHLSGCFSNSPPLTCRFSESASTAECNVYQFLSRRTYSPPG